MTLTRRHTLAALATLGFVPSLAHAQSGDAALDAAIAAARRSADNRARDV